MNKKAQELELRNIMQGLEEFATFMSFNGSSTAGLRILSVETVAQFDQPQQPNKEADVINFPKQPSLNSDEQYIHKSLKFQDRQFH